VFLINSSGQRFWNVSTVSLNSITTLFYKADNTTSTAAYLQLVVKNAGLGLTLTDVSNKSYILSNTAPTPNLTAFTLEEPTSNYVSVSTLVVGPNATPCTFGGSLTQTSFTTGALKYFYLVGTPQPTGRWPVSGYSRNTLGISIEYSDSQSNIVVYIGNSSTILAFPKTTLALYFAFKILASGEVYAGFSSSAVPTTLSYIGATSITSITNQLAVCNGDLTFNYTDTSSTTFTLSSSVSSVDGVWAVGPQSVNLFPLSFQFAGSLEFTGSEGYFVLGKTYNSPGGSQPTLPGDCVYFYFSVAATTKIYYNSGSPQPMIDTGLPSTTKIYFSVVVETNSKIYFAYSSSSFTPI
jgi:hypothetical protein